MTTAAKIKLHKLFIENPGVRKAAIPTTIAVTKILIKISPISQSLVLSSVLFLLLSLLSIFSPPGIRISIFNFFIHFKNNILFILYIWYINNTKGILFMVIY